MGWFSDDIETMEQLFIHSLEDMYFSERQIEKALPDLTAKASDAELRRALQAQLRVTKMRIKRLEQAYKKLLRIPQGVRSRAIEGILDEASEIASDVADKVVLNAALIAAAQTIEHHQITRYGTLTAWARVLGHQEVARLLHANLKEDKAMDKRLNDIAKRKINKKAVTRKPEVLSPDEQLAEARLGIPVV